MCMHLDTNAGYNYQAAHDDVIPLSAPVTTAKGEVVDCISVARGSSITVPIRVVNNSEEIWGPDAKDFKPERWLDNEAGLTPKAKELQGYHHIMSFIDGQRICLGRAFAVAEFKVSRFTCLQLGGHKLTSIRFAGCIVRAY